MFDAKAFLSDKFRTPPELIAFLNAFGVAAPPYDTVYAWFKRGTVPSQWLPVLVCYLEIDAGSPISLSSYLKES